jgi:hypothetical protein
MEKCFLHYFFLPPTLRLSTTSARSQNPPDADMLQPKQVGASTQNKGVLQIGAYCWSFPIRLIMHGMNIKQYV